MLIPNGVDCSLYAGDEPLAGQAEGSRHADVPRPHRRAAQGPADPARGAARVAAAVPGRAAAGRGARGRRHRARPSSDPAVAARVEFLGLVSQEDKARALHSADIYVAPNTGGESFGIILLEAMAAGAPVVASDIEAFQRVLDEGRAGVHFRNEDSEDLAQRLIGLLGDADRRQELRAAGLARAAEFDWSSVARKVVEVYHSVTPGGEKVTADLSRQLWGRLPGRRAAAGADPGADAT